MHKKISLLLLLSTSLVISADHHPLKDDKSNKETKKMEMEMEMEKRGMWKAEDCKKISQTSGAYLYFSGEAFKKRSSLEKDGNQIDAEKHSQKLGHWQNLLQTLQKILKHIAKNNRVK